MNSLGIVVAAGSGARFGRPKAEAELLGVPLWKWAVRALHDGGCARVVVVGDVPDGIPGGERRRDSVAAGLAAASGETHVLIHDAARPLATSHLVAAVIDRLATGVDAVVPVVAVRDTLKAVDGDVVTATMDRSGMVAAQTPQGFRLDLLVEAHRRDDDDATDDAQLVERLGATVTTVPGEEQNLKITYPGDLAVAEALVG